MNRCSKSQIPIFESIYKSGQKELPTICFEAQGKHIQMVLMICIILVIFTLFIIFFPKMYAPVKYHKNI